MSKLGSFSTSPLEWFYSSSVREVVLNAAAKPSCFNVRVIKKKKKNQIVYWLLKKGQKEKGLLYK